MEYKIFMDYLIIEKQLKHFISLSQTSHIIPHHKFNKHKQLKNKVPNFLMPYSGCLFFFTFSIWEKRFHSPMIQSSCFPCIDT